MVTKLCGGCNEEKALKEFTKSNSKNNFKTSNTNTHTYCKSCNAKRARDWRKKAGTSYRGSGKVNSIPKEDRMLMSAIRQRLADAKSRCKKLGKESPILTDNYLYELFKKQERKCALTNTLLCLEKDNPLCLSLDQKNPKKGYVEGNVQWLAWAVNRAKGDLALEDFLDMCYSVLENQKAQRLSH